MNSKLAIALCVCLMPVACPVSGPAQTTTNGSGGIVSGPGRSSAAFEGHAEEALQAMKMRAEELKIGGVAVVAYFEGDKIQSWSSKMLVVGRMKDDQTALDKGNNLIGIAYAKAAEMADTLRDSGSKVRPPMIGEFGWEGGVIVRVKAGYVIVAFSGGKSEDDVAVSRSGAANILNNLRDR